MASNPFLGHVNKFYTYTRLISSINGSAMLQSSVSIPHAPISYGALLETATAASQEAGSLLLEYAGAGFHIEYKNPINLVTDADRAAEQCVIDRIKAHFPTHRFLAEERGRLEEAQSPYLWIIDPLDGTTNLRTAIQPTASPSVSNTRDAVCLAQSSILHGMNCSRPLNIKARG